MKRLWQPRYFMIVVILTAFALLAVRLESLGDFLLSGKPLTSISPATAEDTAPKTSDQAPPNPPPVREAKAEEKKAADKEEAKADSKSGTNSGAPKAETTAAAAAASADGANKEAPGEAPQVALPTIARPAARDLSEGEIEVLKQLSGRRTVLDRRAEEITQKNALLQAAEIQIDKKIQQMEALKKQLQGMLGQVDEQQQAQINNLVKIYENMKPKEAARILQTLEMKVLLSVMRQMKAAKSAAILSEMESAKAKDITMILAKQHELPDAALTQ